MGSQLIGGGGRWESYLLWFVCRYSVCLSAK